MGVAFLGATWAVCLLLLSPRRASLSPGSAANPRGASSWTKADDLLRPKQLPLALLHFDLGMGIRNSFGLWAGNRELLEDCGHDDPDIASAVILARLLERLRGPNPPD